MKKVLAVLQLFPVILEAVKAVEVAVPLSGSGQNKLDLVLGMVQTAYEASNELQKDFEWGDLLAVIVTMITKIVTLLNIAGVFKTTK